MRIRLSALPLLPALLLVFLTAGLRVGRAQDRPLPADDLFKAMTAAAEIGTDETFQELKKQRGYLPDTVAPKGFRSLLGQHEFPFRKLRGGFRQEGTAAALIWRVDAETDKEVAEAAQLVRAHLEADGYVEGEAPTDSFFRPQYSSLERRSKELLTFRKESPPCRELVTIAISDRDARPDSKVTLGAQWCLLGPAEGPPLTHKTVTAAFPMLKGTEVDPRLLDAIAESPVQELDTSLQEAAQDRTSASRFSSNLGGWNFLATGDLRPRLAEALTAADYTAANRPGPPDMALWNRAAGESAMVSYNDLPGRSRTRLQIRRYATTGEAPAAARTANAGNPGSPAAEPRTPSLRPGRKRIADPSAKPLLIATVISTLSQDAGVGTDEAFDVHKESAGLSVEAVAPRGMRQVLLRPDLGLGGLQIQLVRDDAGLTVTWTASARIDAEVATLADQFQEQMTKLGFRKREEQLSGRLPLELMLITRQSKVLQAYEKETGETTEFVIVALSERTVRDPGAGVAILWSVESSAVLAPVTLAAAFEALPALRPADFDTAIVEAFSAAPLREWQRPFAAGSRRRRTSPLSVGLMRSFDAWSFRTHEDLRTGVGDALTGVGFVAAEPSIQGAGGALAQMWSREGEQVSVHFHPVPPESKGILPTLNVTGRAAPGFRPANRPR